jgi:hypothetical protein
VARLWRQYVSRRQQQQPDVAGVLAAWAADQARLGLWPHARTVIADAIARGELDNGNSFVTASKYLTVLQNDLIRWGYLAKA